MKQKLAEISDEMQRLFPNGRGVVVFELKLPDFINIKKDFNVNGDTKQFKIDISGTEIIFILDELLSV